MFSAPIHDSPERTRIAALLIRMLLLLGVGFALAGFASVFVDWVPLWQTVEAFAYAALMFGAIRFVQAGHERPVAWLLPFLVAVSGLSSFVNDAHEGLFLGVLVVAVIIAGLLLHARGALLFGVGCVALLLGGAFAHQGGHWVLARPPLGWGAYVAQAVVLGVAGGLMVWANRGITTMIAALQAERLHLADLNHELVLTQARHEALLEHSFGGIIVVDADMKVAYSNSIAAELLDLPHPLRDLLLEEIPGFDRVAIDEMVGGPVREQLVYLGDNTESRPVGVRVGATTLPDGQPGHLVLLRDLAELEASEQDRGRLRDQLHRSQRMESLGRLAAGLAHDFNNILTVVVGNSELLLMEGGLDPQTEESIRQIRDSGGTASDLTRQLLAFGRQSSRTMEDVAVADLLREFLPMLTTMVQRSVEVELSVEGSPVVRANPGELQQVLANLVINASDAMPDGGTVLVRSERVDGMVILAVTDTGEGMTEATQQQVFEPFFTTKALGAGTGLGLSIVHGIVTSAGGRVETKSRVGEGTTIKLYFPAIDGPPTWSTESGNAKKTLTSLVGASILIVDDEPNVLDAMSRMIASAGATVTSAGDGVSAMEHFAAGATFDAAVLDVLMPGMSGPALAAWIRKRNKTMPIVFVSGHVPRAERVGILESSPHFLPKPVSPGLLTKAISAALDEVLHEPSAQSPTPP